MRQQQGELRLMRQRFDDVGNDLHWLPGTSHVRCDRLDLCDEAAERDLRGCDEQVVGAGEVAVDGPARDAEAVGDIRKCGSLRTAAFDGPQRGIDDALARFSVGLLLSRIHLCHLGFAGQQGAKICRRCALVFDV